MSKQEQYDKQIETLVSSGTPEEINRKSLLIKVAAESLNHYLIRGTYGETDSYPPDTLPLYWSYVRFLTWDAIRPRLGHGTPEYSNQNYTDKFLSDITDEANQIAKLIPEDIKTDEWYFIVHVCATMLMNNPFLVEKGYVSDTGREKMRDNTIMAGPSDDMYHSRFTQWREQFSSGPKTQSTN